MTTRKIRLTLSSELVNDTGAIIDVDFNGENLDADLEITQQYGTDSILKEYTVDVDAGEYNLDITYKNDSALDENSDLVLEEDRNLVIEKVEIADDGVNYMTHYWDEHCGFFKIPNPDYDPDAPTDWSVIPAINSPRMMNSDNWRADIPTTDNSADTRMTDIGDNPAHLYNEVTEHKIYTEGVTIIPITFS